MTIEKLREARRSKRIVKWGATSGIVHRIAKNGSWADMQWFENRLSWFKRQPLDCLADWEWR